MQHPFHSPSSLSSGLARLPKEPRLANRFALPAHSPSNSPQDPRLLDAAQTLVNLHQTADRKSGVPSTSEAALALLTSLASAATVMTPPSPSVIGAISSVSEHSIMPPPPPSNVRGTRGRGAKTPSRGRGRGRGRGAVYIPQTIPKISPEAGSVLRVPALRDVDLSTNDESIAAPGEDVKMGKDGTAHDGGANEKPVVPALEDTTFTVGHLTVKNSVMDDLLNARKLELLQDPEISALINLAMSKKLAK